MKVRTFDSEVEWLEARLGKITGTRLKDLIVKRGTKPKKGYYEIIAERIAIPATEEGAMDRGKRIEEEAIERFAKETGKKVKSDLVLWERDDNPDIAISPDASIGTTEAIEVKCLSSASHLEALLTKTIPSEYEYQVLQYFVVNDKLKKLHFAFYDPRMPKDFFYITVNREDVKEQVEECLRLEQEVLAEISRVEKELTF